MQPVFRILDANLNRAREALRVMEEAARFHLEDAELTGAIKCLRHDLSRAADRLDSLEQHRDAGGDIGAGISTGAELTRGSIAEVALAAGKRLSESLRAIEEYGKTIDSAFAALIESLRYRGYDLEARLNRRLAPSRARQWALCLLLTEHVCARPWRDVLVGAVAGGVDCVQVREKEMNDRDLLQRAIDVIAIARPLGVTIIVNDRPDIALLCGADGVHAGQGDLSCARVRELAGRRLIVGVSTSTLAEAECALHEGADYCGVGPMFPSTTKIREHIAGPDYLRAYLEWDRLPHLAIGGIDENTVAELGALGCRGVAVSSAICAAAEPGSAARRILRHISSVPPEVDHRAAARS